MAERRRVPGTLLDVVILLAVAALAGWLIARAVPNEFHEWPSSTGAKGALYGGAALVALLALAFARGARGAFGRAIGRLVALGVACVLALFVYLRAGRDPGYRWPPAVAGDWAAVQRTMKPAERAEFAARVIMHRLDWLRGTDGAPLPAAHADSLSIPASWLFPDSVQVAIERGGGDTVWVWARADTVVRCAELPQPVSAHDGHDLPTRGKNETQELLPCAGRTPPPTPVYSTVTRLPAEATPVTALPPSVGLAWPQYRGDAAHTALHSDSVPTAATWPARIEGEVRASASLIGDLLVVGTHGNGELAAFDRRTGALRWRRRLPNWVHQDPVSDGRVIVVGFGDNANSFAGQAPSGVVAYAAATGAPLWTVFDETSVMTSPLVTGDALVYVSASGRLRKRRLVDGALLAEDSLPGGVIMGPPAMVGDTAIITLDSRDVCAVQLASLTRLWCRTFPHTILMGHYAPTVVDGVVYAAGSVVFPGLSLGEFRALPDSMRNTALRSLLRPRFLPLGQRLWAMRLADGALLWAGPMHVDTKPIGGHPSGTAVVQGARGVIIYPQQDTLAGFDARTGVEQWRTTGGGSRGPLLLVDSLAVHAMRDGSIVSRSLVTGAVRCRVKLSEGFDRAGPVRAGNDLLAVDRKGAVHRVPVAALTQCAAGG